MITLFSMFPDRMNLNGDAANVLVLARRLELRGIDHRVEFLNSAEELTKAITFAKANPRVAFFSLGHGSKAAIASLANVIGLTREAFELCRSGIAGGICVGDAIELIADAEPNRTERVSEFRLISLSQESWPAEALGYVNSDLGINGLRVTGWLIETTLHGPFFAKNPTWADAVLAKLGASESQAEKIDQLDGYVKKIWELESSH